MSGLADRMKGYEAAWDHVLPGRLPTVIRVDGKAFHTLTRGCEKPFDARVESAMDGAAIALCKGMQNVALAYTQSDEISILMVPYRTLTTEPWLANRVVRMASVAASIATAGFIGEWGGPAHFDARVFVLPEAEVANYFLWRQRDAERNSISGLARSLASHGECHGLNSDGLQELAFSRGVNWNNLPPERKRGRAVVKEGYEHEGVERSRWVLSVVPRFVNEGRAFIETRLAPEESEGTP